MDGSVETEVGVGGRRKVDDMGTDEEQVDDMGTDEVQANSRRANQSVMVLLQQWSANYLHVFLAQYSIVSNASQLVQFHYNGLPIKD